MTAIRVGALAHLHRPTEQPDFGLLGFAHARDMPGVRRKLHNLARRSKSKREADRMQLEQALARFDGRTGLGLEDSAP